MDCAQYTGSKHPELVGKHALVQPHPTNPELVLAQFNDVTLKTFVRQGDVDYNHHTGRENWREPDEYINWGFGWHELPVVDMPLIIRIRVGA